MVGIVLTVLAAALAAEGGFRVKLVTHAGYAPLAAAEELGLFTEAGLSVRIIPLRGVAAAEVDQPLPQPLPHK